MLQSPGEAARKLLQLRQDSHSVADYAVDFRTLAVDSAWTRKRCSTCSYSVSGEVKVELAARGLPMDLDSLISLTIRIDGRLREQ